MRLLTLVLVTLPTAILAGNAAVAAVPGNMTDKLFTLGLATPLIWVGLMLASYWDDRAARPVCLMVALSSISAIILLAHPPV